MKENVKFVCFDVGSSHGKIWALGNLGVKFQKMQEGIATFYITYKHSELNSKSFS